MAKTRLLALLVLLGFQFSIGLLPALALSGQPKAEFDEFIKNLRELKRLEMLGYLVIAKLHPSRIAEDRVISMAGKSFYGSEEGYLTHVNFVRLERLRKSGISYSVIDKKRLDDVSEFWYLVWAENQTDEATIREKFEPLWKHENTLVIRIRPEDENWLIENKIRYSRIEEALLPLRTPATPPEAMKVTVDPAVQKLLETVTAKDLTKIVQSLQDFKTRYVRTEGNGKAVAWLAEEFRKIPGLEVTTPTFQDSSYGSLTNVVAVKKGTTEPNSVYVVCGHLDSIVKSGDPAKAAPGADDNGTGAAGVLLLARALASTTFPCTVVFSAVNAEEVGLLGSKALAKTMANSTGLTVKAALNMDMIADKDDNEVAVIGNTRSNWLIDVFKDTALAYTGLKSKTLYDSNIWYSDHSSFWNIGASAILTIEGYPDICVNYHSVNDLVVNMVPSLGEKIARSQLATLLTLNRMAKKSK